MEKTPFHHGLSPELCKASRAQVAWSFGSAFNIHELVEGVLEPEKSAEAFLCTPFLPTWIGHRPPKSVSVEPKERSNARHNRNLNLPMPLEHPKWLLST